MTLDKRKCHLRKLLKQKAKQLKSVVDALRGIPHILLREAGASQHFDSARAVSPIRPQASPALPVGSGNPCAAVTKLEGRLARPPTRAGQVVRERRRGLAT